jgi:hypothetical protein
MSTNFTEFCDSEDATITAICDARSEAEAYTDDTRAGLNRFFLIFGVSPRPHLPLVFSVSVRRGYSERKYISVIL